MDNWSIKEINIYHKYVEQMIKDGYVEANPKRFVRPKYQDVYDYFYKKLINKKAVSEKAIDFEIQEQASNFYNYWDSLDWYSNNSRIKSWKGRAATWINKYEKDKRNGSTNNVPKKSAADKIAARIAERDR